MGDIIDSIRKELGKGADEKRKIIYQNFFKEQIKTYGIKTPVVGKIGKEYFQLIKNISKAEILGLCEILWQSGYIEESTIACNWSYYIHKNYKPEDFQVFRKWISEYVTNWAMCDTLCNHTLGEFIEMYPDYLKQLKEFTKSGNRWMRRAAAVTLIVPAKKGKFLNDILEIAGLLLTDEDDLVQKGYGWMLKAASKVHQQEVFDFVIRKKAVMPRTALRYAIEKMPKERKALAMEK